MRVKALISTSPDIYKLVLRELLEQRDGHTLCRHVRGTALRDGAETKQDIFILKMDKEKRG